MNRPLWKDLILLLSKSVVTVVTVVAVIFVSAAALDTLWEAEPGISDGACNIAVFPLEGAILPFVGLADFALVITPQTVNDYLSAAEADPLIDGFLLEVNSPGGTPVASEQIAERLAASDLPVVGLIGDIGASGGYLAAAASDFLIASAMSDVGGIGVNMSYVEESQKNEEEGLTYVQLITGEYKDIGSPNRPITEAERELLQADLDLIHNEFIDQIAEYRDLDRDRVVVLADGATMPGRRAIEADLIDAIGGRTQAQAAFAALLDKPLTEVEFCEYDPPILPI